MGTTDLTRLKKGAPFTWGKLIAIHEIGRYSVVEYHPEIFKDCASTGKTSRTKKQFHPYLDGHDLSEGHHSLESALAAAIAYNLEGCNHRADRYFITALESLNEKRG